MFGVAAVGAGVEAAGDDAVSCAFELEEGAFSGTFGLASGC